MPQNEIKYSELSLHDLETILEKIAEDKPTAAIEYIDIIENAIANLVENPQLGVTCKRKRIRKDCRVLIVRSHLVFYKYEEKKSFVYILRILSADQDYRKIL